MDASAHDAFWTVADADDDAVLAAISLDVTAEREAGEIGYWCGPWARRRGVMTAAVRLVRDWAFDELGLERLEITADVDNIASQRVAAGGRLPPRGRAARLPHGARPAHATTSSSAWCPATRGPRPASGGPATWAGRG